MAEVPVICGAATLLIGLWFAARAIIITRDAVNYEVRARELRRRKRKIACQVVGADPCPLRTAAPGICGVCPRRPTIYLQHPLSSRAISGFVLGTEVRPLPMLVAPVAGTRPCGAGETAW